MKNLKKLLTLKNLIIVILSIIIIVMLFTNKKCEEIKETFNVKLTPSTDYTYCQRLYIYNEEDTYAIAACDGEIYIKKNNDLEKKVELQNVLYLYNFYTIGDNLIYILTKDGSVYHLSEESIINDEYNVEKLDLKNIYNIKNFYIGKTREDAYSSKIYAIDIDGNFHLIKDGN